MKIFLLVFCSALAFSSPSICQTTSSTAVSQDFVIGLEDVLAVSVWKEPELSIKDVIVRPDGKISLPLVGDVQASGLTPKKLQDWITERLKEFVASPTVAVIVTKIASQSVSVVGQVGKPGIYYMGSPLTVLELLARVGGFREDAKTKKILIVRKDGTQTQNFLFNFKEVAGGQSLQQNIILKSGDVIIVP
jgi:polysaccharide export outer membrane protein